MHSAQSWSVEGNSVDSGHSYKTLDGGQTWLAGGLGGFKGVEYSKIKFIHPDTGFATRSDGKVFYTHNGGETWASTDILPARSLYALDMLSANRVVIGGELAALLSTSGPGTTPVSPVFEEAEFSVFPNPTSDYLTVGRSIGSPKIEISDVSGRVFTPIWHSPLQLDLSRNPH